MAEQAGHPLDAVFGGARKVAEPGVWTHHHQHVGETLRQNAEIGLRTIAPLVLQAAVVHSPYIDAVETAGDRVEAGRVDDEVECIFGIAGAYARGRNALDRSFVDIDQLDVGLVIDLEIMRLQRDAAGAEAVVLRDQLVGHRGVLYALTDLARDEVGDKRVRLAVHQDIAEIALPDAEARLRV